MCPFRRPLRLCGAVRSPGPLTRRLIDIKTTFFFQEEAWTPGVTTLIPISLPEGEGTPGGSVDWVSDTGTAGRTRGGALCDRRR